MKLAGSPDKWVENKARKRHHRPSVSLVELLRIAFGWVADLQVKEAIGRQRILVKRSYGLLGFMSETFKWVTAREFFQVFGWGLIEG